MITKHQYYVCNAKLLLLLLSLAYPAQTKSELAG